MLRAISLVVVLVAPVALLARAAAEAPDRPEMSAADGAAPAAASGCRPATQLLVEQPPARVGQLFVDKVMMLPDDPEGTVRALVLFDRPRDRVMRLLTQTGRQREFRTDLRELETVQFFEDGSLDEHLIRIMLVSMAYRLRYHFDFPRCRITWRLDPSYENPVERIEGYWVLHALGRGQTVGRFGTRVDVGASVPRYLQDYATRQKVPELVERVRRWVNSDGRWRP